VDLPFRILTVTDPTSKNSFIFFNTSRSLICNSIANTGNIRKSTDLDLSFAILSEKVDSASENPVTQLGDKLDSDVVKLFVFLVLSIIGAPQINPVPK
jgi:hypothetical protein